MMRHGTPAGVCDCGEPTEYVERAPGYVAAEHVARGGRERHAEWVEAEDRRSLGRILYAALVLAAIVVLMVSALSGCVSTAHRLGAATTEGGVAYLGTPAGEARVRAVGAQIGEAAGQAAAKAARLEVDEYRPPWWALGGLGLLGLGCAAWIVVALRGAVRGFERAMVRRDLHDANTTRAKNP